MHKEEKKYPTPIAGAFIFNENNELLLIRIRQWHNKFTCAGGKIEIGESIEAALKREVKEETGLQVKNYELFDVVDGLDLKGKNSRDYKHLIFFDHKVFVEDPGKIALNEEGENFEWHTLDEWLAKDRDEFAPYIYEAIKKLKNSEEQNNFEHKYKRALADYQNLLRQTAKEKAEFGQFAREQFLMEILPVYDHLKMSLEHFNKDTDQNNWIKGIEYVVKQFKDILTSMGAEEIKTVGAEFDHALMEAVENEVTDDGEQDGLVARELSAGYKLNGKVIKAARVVVYKCKM
jgi:nucleoside triphosphatase